MELYYEIYWNPWEHIEYILKTQQGAFFLLNFKDIFNGTIWNVNHARAGTTITFLWSILFSGKEIILQGQFPSKCILSPSKDSSGFCNSLAVEILFSMSLRSSSILAWLRTDRTGIDSCTHTEKSRFEVSEWSFWSFWMSFWMICNQMEFNFGSDFQMRRYWRLSASWWPN